MNLFLPSGYLDIASILSAGYPFVFIVGGRGTGKTYGVLKLVVVNKIPFFYMRRTDTQLQMIANPQFNPFKKLNVDMDWNIQPMTIPKTKSYGFYQMEVDDNGKSVPAGDMLGYGAALSTISNLRGFDASDVRIMILDEFIPEPHERPIKEEGCAFLNAYETVNRNRELQGQEAVQYVCLANANYEANPIFIELGLVEVFEKMKERGQNIYTDDRRGMVIIWLQESPISDAKSKTALYTLTKGSGFASMALGNEFTRDEKGRIASRNLKEYRPVVTVGELTIYRHKSKHLYYVSPHASGGCPVYGSGSIEATRYRRAYPAVWHAYLSNLIEFETYTMEIYFRRLYNL